MGTSTGHFLGLNPVFSPGRTRHKFRDASMFAKRSEKLLLLSGFGGSVWRVCVATSTRVQPEASA